MIFYLVNDFGLQRNWINAISHWSSKLSYKKQSNLALEKGEVPVGWIFYHTISKKIIAQSHNLTNLTSNATTHAEINCIEEIAFNLQFKSEIFSKKFNLTDDITIKNIFEDCILFVTCEPCIMCAYALSIISK